MNNNLVQNLENIQQNIPDGVTLVAVSKTKPMEDIEVLYQAGQRIFGENRVEELVEKHNSLHKDIAWHMIGHLQSKKVKKIASFVDLIHGVDSLKLLKEINKQAKKEERTINCLLQFHIAREESKFGLDLEDFETFIKDNEFKGLNHINIKGVMGMATFTKDEEVVRNEFKSLKKISEKVKQNFSNATIISMGMSGDYPIAIEEGATMVRVGSSIFGSRN